MTRHRASARPWSTRWPTRSLPSPTLIFALVLGACGQDGARDSASSDASTTPDSGRHDAPDDDVTTPADVVPDMLGTPPQDPAGPHVLARWDHASFWDHPWPEISRVRPDGTPDLAAFPNPANQRFVRDIVDLLERDTRGFGLTTLLVMPTSDAMAISTLPETHATRSPGASVFVIDIGDRSPHRGARHPIEVGFDDDAGPHGADLAIVARPYPGAPLQPSNRYAFVVTRDVTSAHGEALVPSGAMERLIACDRPPGMSGDTWHAYQDALDVLAEFHTPRDTIAAIAVFETGDPAREMIDVAAHAPSLEPGLATFVASYDDYCVFETTASVPVYQDGTPPFSVAGGAWVFNGPDALIEQGRETARIYVSVPHGPVPDGGLPALVFVRTGGGGDLPLIDRGVRFASGEPSPTPGTGLAADLAAAGYAGVMIDGPHGGLRNITGGDEQFLIFNIANPPALRDNIRQSALELTMLIRSLDRIAIDVGACDVTLADASSLLRSERVALFGHSMGATIAPLTAAATPEVEILLLSGAGGSWVENVLYKDLPLPVRPLARRIIGYRDRDLGPFDPVLHLFQWAGESADPQVYAPLLAARHADSAGPPLHVLMVQGIADRYIYPPIAGALSLPLGLDLVGDAHDLGHPDTARFTGITEAYEIVGAGQARAAPVAGNRGASTAALVQFLEDGVEDGHEVMFQLAEPKHMLRCFLSTALLGAPTVIAPDARCR